ISSAALLNALDIVGKKIGDIVMVMNGAGAAAISCSKLYLALGMKKENLIMCDSKGVIDKSRKDLDDIKAPFATSRKYASMQEALKGADVFVGLSKADILTPADILAMSKDPIVFALANPNPEIGYDLAMKTRTDLIMGTGRSDHPNQINNVLGFPYIFRGALDVRATEINEAMKLAAVHALATLAKEPIPDTVLMAYGTEKIEFGKDYLIPKPLDYRLITTVAPAVAKAAMDSGMATKPIEDWGAYHQQLQKRIGIDQKLINKIIDRAKKDPKRVVFAEADNIKVLKAAQILQDEGIAVPILLGNRLEIERLIKENKLEISNCTIIDPKEDKARDEKYTKSYYEKRQRKGVTYADAQRAMRDRNAFGAMMVDFGEADALISGLTRDYSKTILPALQIIGMRAGVERVAGMYIIFNKKGTYFFSDCTVNVDPTPNELAGIIGLTARGARFFEAEARVAVLSYSNFGSSKGDVPDKAREAVRIARERYPNLIIEGDIQANVALNCDLQRELYPFSALAKEGANTLIFPNLSSANIAYKLLMEIGGAETIGPILLGMKKPVHILQLGSSIREIVNMAAIAVVDAQIQYELEHHPPKK
ncbi:MAG TPA: phosphate acyltransferase, partial [Cyclobacteriaceae bacterium]|nr:phosphate acyltransferase [Cyclobacteriaceae bacterium]